MNPRLAAVQVALRVIDSGESLTSALPAAQTTIEERERPLVQELSYGVIRWHLRLNALAERLLRKPLRRRDLDVALLLEIGLYQLIHMHIPAYAAIDQTVQATRTLGKPWASGLVNAVLRRYLREAAACSAGLDQAQPAVRYSMPEWLIGRLERAYPGDWARVCGESNARPPMSLRVNLLRCGRDAYLARLDAAGIAAAVHPMVPSAIVLSEPVPVTRLPGFGEGLVSVQDAAAQLAAPLLGTSAGMRVLDACAAPGGKTAHVLESAANDLDLVAVDIDSVRLSRVAETLSRLGLDAQLVAGDASRPQSWWDGRPFDRILLDAPCSGTGVIRRHPDIKLHRRVADIVALEARQDALLSALWPLLGPGGMLLYVTCSVLPEENVQRVSAFMAGHTDAAEHPIEHVGWGRPCRFGRQILTGEDGMDGFYFARITKTR